MKMLRSFIPVGQGAFYCEQFMNEESSETINIVYDCGSKSKSIIEKQIENTFDKGETINAVFISHFHYDHVSGLEHLLEYCNVKTIFLPMVTNEDRIALYLYNIINGYKKSDFISRFIYNYKESLLKKSESTEIYEIEPYSRDNQFQEFINKEVSYGKTKKHIRSGGDVSCIITDFSFNKELSNWIFVPFNYEEKNDVENLKQALNAYAKSKGFNYTDLPQKITKESIKEIKRIYLDVLKGAKHFNTNSMTLYSGDILGKSYQKYVGQKYMRRYCKGCYNCGDLKMSGCLYTGDYDMSDDNKFFTLIESYENRLNKGFSNKSIEDFVGCIQIPHHGSKNNYNTNISVYNSYYVISAGTKNMYGHPHSFVIKNLLLNDTNPLVVTEEANSAVYFRIYS